MQVDAKALAARGRVEPRGVTEECRTLTVTATEPAELRTLARFFRWMLAETRKKETAPRFGPALDQLLDAAGFEDKHRKLQDEGTRRVFAAVKAAFPDVPPEVEKTVYRRGSLIRVRVVSKKFDKVASLVKRADMISAALDALPERDQVDVAVAVGFTPREARRPRDHPWMRAFDDNAVP